jgi:predicted dehydrogenase
MGALHARKLAWLAGEGFGVALAGVADLDGGRAAALAASLGTVASEDHRAVFAVADAAVVAVPTVEHYAVVLDALKAGLHVLVEKPIAASLPEAEALLAEARSQERLLQVGHLERFNDALLRVSDSIRDPRFIEAHRLGPFPARSTDVDVVRDVMIHDLDIIQRLVGAEPERIEAVGVPILSGELDIANARLTFPDGCVANVTASRVSPTPLRKIRIFQPDAYLSVDFLEHRAAIFRADPTRSLDPSAIRMEPLVLDREDALDRELRAFVEGIDRGGDEALSPEAAMRALRTALRITEAMPELSLPGAGDRPRPAGPEAPASRRGGDDPGPGSGR